MSDKKTVAIVGAGLVGLTLSIALAMRTEYRILLLENKKSLAREDQRSLVLSNISINFLNELQIFERLPKNLSKIKHIHISNHGLF